MMVCVVKIGHECFGDYLGREFVDGPCSFVMFGHVGRMRRWWGW